MADRENEAYVVKISILPLEPVPEQVPDVMRATPHGDRNSVRNNNPIERFDRSQSTNTDIPRFA